MSEAKQLLLRYCNEGDEAAFDRFYRQQANRLWRFLRARGCSADGAYDLLAETFLKFIRVVCKDPRSPVALLYRIAVNLHIDSYRRDTASPFVSDDAQSGVHIDNTAEFSDEHEYLRALIETLPKDEQNLLLMRYWIGLTHKEIAGIVEIPAGTIRRQCAAIIKKLRQRWQEENGG
ncbi:MAG: RNA polymerase sigma factor [Gammaproteobacteria bacterium]